MKGLVAPLKYAAGKRFTKLESLKGLLPLLEAALVEAKASGASPARIKALERELPLVDTEVATKRRTSLKRLYALLVEDGLVESEAEEAAPVSGPKASVPEETARVLGFAPAFGPLALPLSQAAGRVNPRLIAALNRKGIARVGELIFLLPRVYEDRRAMKKIAQLISGERNAFVAWVRSAEDIFIGRGKRMFRAVLADETGSIAATHYQTGPWLKAKFPVGKRLVVSGDVRQTPRGWEIPHPEVEPADDDEATSVHFGRIVPVYPGFERHEQRSLRALIDRLRTKHSADIVDALPEALRKARGLMTLEAAIAGLHAPTEDESLEALNAHRSAAHQRLAYDELFFLQLGMALRRRGIKTQAGIAFHVTADGLTRAKALLPFTLTRAQERVVAQVATDMARPEPMNRLLQGDVGSGKTAVALIATALALDDGYQVAIMAPTEILAEQHHRNFSKWLSPTHDVALMSGSLTTAQRKAARDALATGKTRVAVGTHALIQEGVDFAKLGLVVVDEQHRFGVMQRHALMAKGVRPDVLVMTATPIPRTLAMTLYGDLDVSVIDELPPGRTPIETKVFNVKARPRAWDLVARELAKGHQAYVVFPLVEESEKVDLADATKGLEDLRKVFPDARLGLLHGRLSGEEKDAVMSAFRAGRIDLLVCTTVIEVGVDVPNASVMVIEAAEQFGLSQLHQLRGRVGRGAAKSYCVLVAGYALSTEARARLSVMEQSTDGFVIAERDLELRGPGEFLGTRQSGIPELAVANLVRDQPILAQAQEDARAIVAADPTLSKAEHRPMATALEERWQGRLKLATVG